MAGNNPIWYNTLRQVVDPYPIEELEQGRQPQGNMLSAAVVTGSVVAARVPLEKGVKINKPYPAAGAEMTAIHD